jgi:hypothetical protein
VPPLFYEGLMADKVKPLKIEDTTSGSQNDGFPVETNPAQDYIATKGIAFENSNTRLLDLSAGGEIQYLDAVQGTYKTLNSIISTPIIFYLETANSHVHAVELTLAEATNLLRGISASVVKTSSTESAHTHSVTITFNTTTAMFEAVVASGGLVPHVHSGIPQNNTAIIPIYHLAGATGHIHTNFLTQIEANALMSGTVASVVKNSSLNAGHVHVTTITYNATLSRFEATVATASAHIHIASLGGTAPFGANFNQASSTADSTTTNAAMQTKLTMTTTTLPLANYILLFSFATSNSGNKEVDNEVRQAGTRIFRDYGITGVSSAAADNSARGGFVYLSQISGAIAFDIRYRAPNGSTARISNAYLAIFRVT